VNVPQNFTGGADPVEAGLTARVDLDACKGHGRCYAAAPDTFDSDDEGYPVVIATAATPAQLQALRRAVRNCPEKAISATPS
jgi:ferredoxin